MSVDRGEVEHIARLAKLSLGADEVDRFTVQLNAILGHMDQLSRLDAEAAEAEAEAGPEVGAPLRDENEPPDALAFPPADLATAWRDGFFVVPRLAAQDRLAEGGDAEGMEDGDDA